MDLDRQEERSRKRKSTDTPQSESPKRRDPDAATMPSCLEEVEAEAEVHSEDNVSISDEALSSDTADEVIKMPPLTLEGDTLARKRQHYNKLVEDAVANRHYELRNISDDDSDIDNLLKIGIASKIRNVDFIIEVMKSNDMLYAATAIKKSTWLFTDTQYANIINPEYLHTQLLPSMNTKTFNKLMLHIRLNLKDESRVEAFYEYFKDTGSAYKWLENCSISFIENVIEHERIIPLSLFKRLCRRSAHFIAYYTRVELRSRNVVKNETLFLLKSHTADVLTVLEDKGYDYFPELGKKKTEVLMKTCRQGILDNFDQYAHVIDLSVVAKYLENTKAFLYKHARSLRPRLYDHNTLRHFVKNMPAEERFQFVKKTFINKTEMTLLFSEEERRIIESNIKPYQWYEFAPFHVAWDEITKLVRKECSPSERCAMLSVLITCTRQNLGNNKILLTFFKDRHINEPFKFKLKFINNLLTQLSTHSFDEETWNLLDNLFHSMGVYSESENDVQMCLECITVYKVLRDEPVKKIIEEKMIWNSFKKVQKKLNQEQNSKLFTYLLKSVLNKVHTENIATESDFRKTVLQLKNVLTLLRDWEKDISEFSSVLQKIQELIKIKRENMWKTDMSGLYNLKKSWRRHMFEESLSLCLSEETCLNALKHKPQLLTRHDKEIDTLRTNDAVSLRRLLTKLRVYWPGSLVQHWTDAYRRHLYRPIGQKAVIKGLFTLFPQKQITEMAINHAPHYLKINWKKADQVEISVQKNIAKQLHLARPLISLDTILWYAKGDNLQHAVPSLNAILYNMSEVDSREHLPKLLNAPVSLRKFGLHLVYFKLRSDELISTYSEVWDTTENTSIQYILFKHTYERMCKVKNPTVEKKLWELLSTFLNYVFSGSLGHVERVPISVRAAYYMKSYEFICTLPRNQNFESYEDDILRYAPNVMDLLDKDFVADKMLSPAISKFCLYESQFMEIFACYVLCGKSEEDQLQRSGRVLDPALDEAFQSWDKMHSGHYYVRDNFKKFLESLVWYLRTYITFNKIPMPTKLFVHIKTEIENRLPVLKNYVLFTSFKLIVEYVKLLDEKKCMSIALEFLKFSESQIRDGRKLSAMAKVWKHIHFKICPSLGPVIVKCLKEDTERYSPTIHGQFAKAFEKMFQMLNFKNCDLFVLETLKYMLNDNDFVPSYLVVCKVIPKDCNDELKCIQSEIRKKLRSHPSTTVQVHYYNYFPDIKQFDTI